MEKLAVVQKFREFERQRDALERKIAGIFLFSLSLYIYISISLSASFSLPPRNPPPLLSSLPLNLPSSYGSPPSIHFTRTTAPDVALERKFALIAPPPEERNSYDAHELLLTDIFPFQPQPLSIGLFLSLSFSLILSLHLGIECEKQNIRRVHEISRFRKA